MKMWYNDTEHVSSRCAKAQGNIFIYGWLITKRIKRCCFQNSQKSVFRFRLRSLFKHGKATHFDAFTDKSFRLVPGVSSVSVQHLLHTTSHRVDETDNPSLWNSVRLFLEKCWRVIQCCLLFDPLIHCTFELAPKMFNWIEIREVSWPIHSWDTLIFEILIHSS